MRKIAGELGISKSALYHYFPTKQALFHACTNVVTTIDLENSSPNWGMKKDAPIELRLKMLFEAAKELEDRFPDELSLLVDYLRDRTKNDIAGDPTMQLANTRYLEMTEMFLSKEHAKPVLCLLLGTLLMRFLDGEATSFDEIEDWLSSKIDIHP